MYGRAGRRCCQRPDTYRTAQATKPPSPTTHTTTTTIIATTAATTVLLQQLTVSPHACVPSNAGDVPAAQAPTPARQCRTLNRNPEAPLRAAWIQGSPFVPVRATCPSPHPGKQTHRRPTQSSPVQSKPKPAHINGQKLHRPPQLHHPPTAAQVGSDRPVPVVRSISRFSV